MKISRIVIKAILIVVLIKPLAVSTLNAQVFDPVWKTSDTTENPGNTQLPIAKLDGLGDIIICDVSNSPGPLSGFLTSKYNKDGEVLWKRTYDTFVNDEISSMVVGPSGSVYVCGNSISFFSMVSSFILFKYSANGDSLWAYENPNLDVSSTVTDLFLTEDQNLMLFASYIDVDSNGLIITKLDTLGNTIWETRLSDGNSRYTSLQGQELDNGYIFWGVRFSTLEPSRFIKINVDINGGITQVQETGIYTDFFSSFYSLDKYGNLYIGDSNDEYKITKYNGRKPNCRLSGLCIAHL